MQEELNCLVILLLQDKHCYGHHHAWASFSLRRSTRRHAHVGLVVQAVLCLCTSGHRARAPWICGALRFPPDPPQPPFLTPFISVRGIAMWRGRCSWNNVHNRLKSWTPRLIWHKCHCPNRQLSCPCISFSVIQCPSSLNSSILIS